MTFGIRAMSIYEFRETRRVNVFAILAGVIEITFTGVPWSPMIFRKERTCR